MSASTRARPRLPAIRRRRTLPMFPMALMLTVVLACQGDGLSRPEPADESLLYWALDLNHRAVTLSTTAPYDTLTLIATPRNPQGEPITGLSAAQYTSLDPDRLLVTPEGKMQARKAGSALIRVITKLTVENMTRADTALVLVVNNDSPPVLASLSMDPVPPDSAKTGVRVSRGPLFSTVKYLPIEMLDAEDAPITGLPLSVKSSDTSVAKVLQTAKLLDSVPGGGITVKAEGFGVQGFRPGTVSIYATTTAFGVTKADTLLYRIGTPFFQVVQTQRVVPVGGAAPYYEFFPAEVTVGVGGVVGWEEANGVPSGDTVDINFAPADLPSVTAASAVIYTVGFLTGPLLHSECNGSPGIPFLGISPTPGRDCGSGNFTLTGTPPPSGEISRGRAYRVFTEPGVYEYHSARKGIAGRVVVVADE